MRSATRTFSWCVRRLAWPYGRPRCSVDVSEFNRNTISTSFIWLFLFVVCVCLLIYMYWLCVDVFDNAKLDWRQIGRLTCRMLMVELMGLSFKSKTVWNCHCESHSDRYILSSVPALQLQNDLRASALRLFQFVYCWHQWIICGQLQLRIIVAARFLFCITDIANTVNSTRSPASKQTELVYRNNPRCRVITFIKAQSCASWPPIRYHSRCHMHEEINLFSYQWLNLFKLCINDKYNEKQQKKEKT